MMKKTAERTATGSVQMPAHEVVYQQLREQILFGEIGAGTAYKLIVNLMGSVQIVALAEGMAVARQLYQPAEFVAVDYDNIPTAVFSLPNMATCLYLYGNG